MTQRDGPMRVFVALSISQAAKLTLKTALGDLAALVPSGVRWADPEGLHLTLKFLGDVEPALVNDIAEIIRQSAKTVLPFQVQLSGLGMFPNARRPRVLWAGLQGDLEPLQELQAKLEDGMAALGFSRERRPFSPHLILGRIREQLPDAIRRHIAEAISAVTMPASELWLVESAYLVRSHLAPEGATYSALTGAPLGGSVQNVE